MFKNINFLSKTWDCSFNIFTYIFPTYFKSKTYKDVASEQKKPVSTRQNQISSTLSTAAEPARPWEATW